MSPKPLPYALVLALSSVLLLAACTGGKKGVVFSAQGTPHCPYCLTAVPPMTDRCAACGLEYRWTADFVTCWRCQGTADCPACEGSGFIGKVKCLVCGGSGSCPECDERGLVRHGPPH